MLDDEIKARNTRRLTAYCDEKVPLRIRDRLVLQFRFENQSVVLLERRPYFRVPNQWIEHPVAKFRYFKARKTWALYCRDRNAKWHKYGLFPWSRRFDTLLGAVNEDPTGIFWG